MATLGGSGPTGITAAGLLPAVLEDLEQQAAGLALEERDDVVRDLADAAYAEVTVAARLHAAIGATLRFRLAGGWRVDGEVQRVGADFVVLGAARRTSWVVRLAAIRSADGLPLRSRSGTTLPVTARLGFGSVVRHLGETECTLHDVDGIASSGWPVRTGADFVELGPAPGATGAGRVVPLEAIAALRSAS